METFGQEGGREVDEKEKILSKIDLTLECPHPPMVEYIFTEPCRLEESKTIFQKFLNYSFNWGHASLRYTLPNGQAFLVNILNPETKKPFVAFLNPTDYFFSTSPESYGKSEQFGIYMRSYVCLRIEKVMDKDVLAIHNYFLNVQKKYEQGLISFAPTGFHSIIYGMLYKFGKISTEPGNCSEWISRALVAGGLLKYPRIFPKRVVVDLIIAHHHQQETGGFHIVSMRRAKHSVMHPSYKGWVTDSTHPGYHTYTGQTHFLNWITSEKYRRLEKYADLVVEVPNNGSEVRILKQTPETICRSGLWAWLLHSEWESIVLPFFGGGVILVESNGILGIGGNFDRFTQFLRPFLSV